MSAMLEFKVLSNAKAIASDLEVESIEIHNSIDSVDYAHLNFIAKPETADAPDLALGREITIEAGYDGDLATLFRGQILSQEYQAHAGMGLGLLIECEEVVVNEFEAQPTLELTYGEDVLQMSLNRDVDESLYGHIEIQGQAVSLSRLVVVKGLTSAFAQPTEVGGVHHQLAHGEWLTALSLGEDLPEEED